MLQLEEMQEIVENQRGTTGEVRTLTKINVPQGG